MTEEKKKGGVKAVVEMLNHMSPAEREKLLANVARQDPMLAVEIQKQLFVFENIIQFDLPSFQVIYRSFPEAKWALALRVSSPELKAYVLGSISVRGRQSLEEALEALGLQRVGDVEDAQREILKRCVELEAEGKIIRKDR